MKTFIYNGLTDYQIKNNLPKNMIPLHKRLYLNNCLFVYQNEKEGYNLDYCKLIRDANNRLIKQYLNL